ncbi:MAG: 16S rRNA (cytosine(1402)-N(4))-methyltransferase RsmH [Clostridia bacterium]|nr:16S rRNA (cytosine(1402)-N(4))-methyltransferase RsmH [Clostridia bacterium]
MEFRHYSVMHGECIDALDIKPDGVYVDCTLGGGGHSLGIASRLENGLLIGIDRDAEAIAAATERLKEYSKKTLLVNDNFSNLKAVLRERGIAKVDGILFDLGVSSYQLDNAERGFTYRFDAPLDMRMSKSDVLTARGVVNDYSQKELSKIIFEYGEEKYAGKIAAEIVRAREKAPIETTYQLNDIIKKAFPPSQRYGEKHPSKRTYQAIRIEVNGELQILEKAVRDAVECLKPSGRIAIMTFHSLEDRIVKNVLRDLSTGCTCNKNIPVCVCGRKEIVKLINKKPVTATKEELENNLRSKPAKLRVAEKI